MNNKPRKVKFSTKINILKKKPISIIYGFGFTVFPLFIATILFIVFSSLGNETPKVDYELISSKGKQITAKITDIETQYNVTINGVHPTVISYKYLEKGKETVTKYKVIEERKIEKLEIGNSIQIKVLNGNSILKDLRPYDFESGFILLTPIPFLIIGISFLIYSIRNLKKEVNLYKYGKVSKARIISIMPKSGVLIPNFGRGFFVHYDYTAMSGKKIFGESVLTDFSIMSDKKKDDFISIFISKENEEESCVIPKLQSLRNNWNIEFE